MKKILILVAGFLLLCMNVFADDVSINSSGNTTNYADTTGKTDGVGNASF